MEITTKPKPPETWLAIYRCPDGVNSVSCILASPTDPRLEAVFKNCPHWRNDPRFVIWKDDPALDVSHSGIEITSPECLTARDNWFRRFHKTLAEHLKNPRKTIVYTFEKSELTDPFETHKTTARGRVHSPVVSLGPFVESVARALRLSVSSIFERQLLFPLREVR